MGFRLRKSFKIGAGFRINLSTRGVGASWGVPGFRIGTGPSGTRVHAGIPGTGLGWSGGVGGGRRIASQAGASYREMAAAQRQAERWAELERSRYEVGLHEQHIRALQTVHQEGWSTWDWRMIASSPPPQEPLRHNVREVGAVHALQSHTPGVLSKLLGSDRQLADLQHTVLVARAQDEQEYGARYAAFREELDRWSWFQKLSRGILSGDPEACQTALDYLGPFQTFQQLGSSLNVCITQPWCVEAWLTANSQSIVPREALSLTATGKVSRRTMPVGRYWAIYQDHVCSAALRVAREVFALLPVPVTLVHVGYPHTNPQTGREDRYSILSVAFDRDTFDALNLNAIDPSDSMANFEHRMKYKKNSGFEPIELLTPNDLAPGDA